MNNRGSATVEASLVLPLFLFFVISLCMIGRVYLIEEEIYSAFVQTAKEISVDAYAMEGVVGTNLSNEGENILNDAYVYTVFYQYLDEIGGIENSVVGKRAGFSFLESDYKTSDYMTLRLSYVIKVDIPLFKDIYVPICEEARIHPWTGMDELSDAGEVGKYVYVSDYESVYHTDRECSYLSLSILSGDKKDVLEHKLSPCGFCGDHESKGVYYYTAEGDHFHTDERCSGLKRSTHIVSIDEADGLHPCTRCGSQ